MWPDLITALNLALFWLIGLTIIFLLLDRPAFSNRLAAIKRPLLFLILTAMIARLVPLFLLPVGAGYDIESFKLVGDAFLNGEEIYTSAAQGRHPYLPLQVYVIGLTTYLSQVTQLPFVIWQKLPSVLADLIITATLYEVFRRWGAAREKALLGALLYALNPISVLVSSYHGQFDAVPVLLLLLAWFAWEFGKHVKRSAVFLGFAILDKTWPAVFFPVIFIRLPDNKRRLVYSFITLAIPALFTLAYVLFYNSDPVPMLRRALTHAGIPGYWGISVFLSLAENLTGNGGQLMQTVLPFQRVILLLAGLAALWWTRRQPALDALLTIFLAIFTVTLGMGIQWLLWPVAFAIAVQENRWLKWYTLTGAFMMAVHLYGLHLYPWANTLFDPQTADLIIRLSAVPVWIVVLLWAVQRLRQARSQGQPEIL